MYLNRLAVIFFTCLLLSQSGLAQERPDWIDNPGNGAVGSAPTHIQGKHAQEELAISRARIRLAARLGVVVDSIQHIEESVANDQSSVTSERKTTQKISGATVKSHTQALWHDVERDVIYVWLIPVE